MPVEIRELIIRATVVNDSGQSSNRGASAKGSTSNEATIAACVAQVLKILERKRGR
ncbi:MAG: DUF5908 family protein [Cyanobacteria bacterium J06621_11]